MDDLERFEGLLDVLAELRELNGSTPILVEGQRDVSSLRLLGMKGDIITLHSGDALFLVAETIAARTKDVVLLTDWDEKGRTLCETLTGALQANGVRVDRTFRDRIRRGTKPTLKDVESLASYVGRGLVKFHRKDLGEPWA